MSVFIILTLGKTLKTSPGLKHHEPRNAPAFHSPWLTGCSSSKNQIGTSECHRRQTLLEFVTNAPWYSIPVIVSQIMMCAFLCTLHNVSSARSYIIHPNTFKYCIWILCNNPKADSKPCLMGVSNVNHIHGEVVSGHCVLHDPIYATCVGSKTEVPPTITKLIKIGGFLC